MQEKTQQPEQSDNQSVNDPSTPDGSQPTLEDGPPPPKSKKRLLLVLLGTVVIVVMGVLVWVASKQEPQSSIAPNDQAVSESTQLETPVLTYQECVDAGYDETAEDDGCITPDGIILYPGDPELDEIAPEEEPATDNDDSNGQQSVKLMIGEEESGYTIFLTKAGESTIDLQLNLLVQGLDAASCTLSVALVPDRPDERSSSYMLEPKASQLATFKDGKNTLTASCPGSNGPLRAQLSFGVGDKQPERCRNFNYQTPTKSSVANLEELRSGIAGTWTGCVESPWWAPYFVTLTLNENGLYEASSDEELDGHVSTGGFYLYNIEGTHKSKIYGIATYQNGMGQGFLDIVHPNGSTIQRGDLRNIKLNGDLLTFDFYHVHRYGPLRFMLEKQ